MKVIIDTSSLLSLVRYYLPFDSNKILFEFIKFKIESEEILILDKVFEECKYTAKGLVISTLDYINDKKVHIKTEDILPYRKFFNQLENQFCNASWKNQLSTTEFENRKDAFLDSADAKILLYSLRYRTSLPEDKIIIVTEETVISNDNKAFKKLPAICKILELDVMTLPDLLKMYEGINFEFK